MPFEFGMIAELNPRSCMWAMIGIVGFIVTFDFFIGFLEFFLEDSPLYNRMVQTIYKELMQMGIISLIVVLFEALASQNTLENAHEMVLCMEFAHIVLFFVAIFLVTHAFFLMGVSILASKEFVVFYNRPLQYLKEQYDALGCIGRTAFLYSPLSSLREEVEFKILHAVFRDTYTHLPLNFDFSMYLQKCQQKYAMRTTEVSIVSWIVVLSIVVANFFRATYSGPLSCGAKSVLILRHILGDNDDYDGEHVDDDHETEHFRRLSSEGEGSDSELSISDLCYRQYTYLFCVAALLVTALMAVLMIMSRVYMLRLISRSGISSTSEYMGFITFCEADRQKYEEYRRKQESQGRPYQYESFRLSGEQVKKAIDEYFDDNEVGERENKLYSAISEGLLLAWETCFLALKKCVANMQGKNKLSVSQLVHHSHGGEILGAEGDTDKTSLSLARPEGVNIAVSPKSVSVFTKTMQMSKKSEKSSSERKVVDLSSPLMSPERLDPEGKQDESAQVSALTEQEKAELGIGAARSTRTSSIVHNLLEVKGSSSRFTLAEKVQRVDGTTVSGNRSPGRDQAENEYFCGTTVLGRYLKRKPRDSKVSVETVEGSPASPNFSAEKSASWTGVRSNSVAPSQPNLLSDNFDDIFLFGNRNLFFRAVEVAIMVVSLYMAMWITNFITIVSVHSENSIGFQLFL
jgi:hypothetical protein